MTSSQDMLSRREASGLEGSEAGRIGLLVCLAMWAGLASVVLIPAITWASEIGSPFYPLWQAAPPGQGAYLGSRLLGLYALLILWFQCLAGLQMPRLRQVFSAIELRRWHARSGLLLLGLVLLHPITFFVGVARRGGRVDVPHWLIPTFDSGYYPAMLSVGRVALALLLLGGIVAPLLGRLVKWGGWLFLHRFNGVALLLGGWHAVAIGSETRSGAMPWLLGFMLLSIVLAVVDRLRGTPPMPMLTAGLGVHPAPATAGRWLFGGSVALAVVTGVLVLSPGPDLTVPSVEARVLASRVGSGSRVVLVDVREPQEFLEERIPGAVNCQVRSLAEGAAKLCRDADLVVVYCLKDFRGYEGLRVLEQFHPDVRLIHGFGLNQWKSQQLATAGSRVNRSDGDGIRILRQFSAP